MDLKQVRETAREKMKGYCRVCPVCDGRACAGSVPGIGGTGTGSAFNANLEALAKVKLNLRTIHQAKEPDLSLTLFGEELATPILAAPITGASINMGGALTEREMVDALLQGALAAGSLGMTGDTGVPSMYDDGLAGIKAVNGKGIPFIKPRSQEEIKKRIDKAEAAGALAVGVDVDGAGLITMALNGQPVGPKSVENIKELVSYTKLPFIVKGIMTVDEAKLMAEAGVAAIVVSNHGGRVLDHTLGAADVLPEIADAVKGKVTILADGGVRSGVDVLKLLALGADAVLVGRPLIIGAFGGGSEGVKLTIETYTKQLLQAMILTGTEKVTQVSRDILVC
ncbi:MAG: alpha-hydroxy-acid oxidizing protein [Thermoanaerobacteraceae bacterium]|nr:alpha-hydroxy-acid oxidizing protein [Thermoanaerobacteraceae bacterium]